MMKALKTITLTLMMGSILSFNSPALANNDWQGRPKDKTPERPKERDKGGGDRGKGDKKPKDKKPGGHFF